MRLEGVRFKPLEANGFCVDTIFYHFYPRGDIGPEEE
jgi:hypothetical protein